ATASLGNEPASLNVTKYSALSGCQASYIDECISFISAYIPPGYFEVVFEHNYGLVVCCSLPVACCYTSLSQLTTNHPLLPRVLFNTHTKLKKVIAYSTRKGLHFFAVHCGTADVRKQDGKVRGN